MNNLPAFLLFCLYFDMYIFLMYFISFIKLLQILQMSYLVPRTHHLRMVTQTVCILHLWEATCVA